MRFLSLLEKLNIVFDNQPEIVGLAAGICTSISLLPQLVKLVKQKKAEDISIFYLIILFVGLALWMWYGFLRQDTPILVTNGFSLVINGVVIFLGIKYKRSNRKDSD
ncbi:MAG: SemiSWEET transporter [Cyclobacteriaceae bacterium]